MDIRRSTPGHFLPNTLAGSLPIALGLLCGGNQLFGQEALRSAVEGDRNLRQRILRSQTPVETGMRFGPVQMTVGIGLDLTFTDNALNSPNKESDFIVEPTANIGMFYQVTDTSRVSVGLGLTYQFYTQGTRDNRLTISPNSELAYDFQVGDALITIYDRVSYSSDALDQGELVNQPDYGGVDNTIGTRVLYSPEPMFVEGGVAHFNFWPNDTTSSDLTRASEQVFFRVGHIIAQSTRWGMETSGSYTRYKEPTRSDLYQWSVGPFLEWAITPAWSLSGRFGWSWTEFERNGLIPAPDDVSVPYVGLSVAHAFTDNFSHRWSATRDVSTGVNTQIVERFRFEYGLNWQFTDVFGFSAGATYEIGEQPGVSVTENYDYYGFNFGFPFSITDNLTTSLRYNFNHRDSNLPGRNYSRNEVTLSLNYRF